MYLNFSFFRKPGTGAKLGTLENICEEEEKLLNESDSSFEV